MDADVGAKMPSKSITLKCCVLWSCSLRIIVLLCLICSVSDVVIWVGEETFGAWDVSLQQLPKT